MSKIIQIPSLTENQSEWLKNLLTNASADALGMAKNNHVFALGTTTQEEAIELEKSADEQREFSKILLHIAVNI